MFGCRKALGAKSELQEEDRAVAHQAGSKANSKGQLTLAWIMLRVMYAVGKQRFKQMKRHAPREARKLERSASEAIVAA